MARPMPPVSPCAPWPCSGTSTPMGLARAATPRRGALRSTTSMASSITPTGSTTCSSPPPWEGGNYEPRNPMESATSIVPRSVGSLLFTLLHMIWTCDSPFPVHHLGEGESHAGTVLYADLYDPPVSTWAVGCLPRRPRDDPTRTRICSREYSVLSASL